MSDLNTKANVTMADGDGIVIVDVSNTTPDVNGAIRQATGALPVAKIPSLPTSKITSGTFANSLLPLGQEHLYIPAAAMISRTTSGAEAASTELATNDVMLETMNFDTAADEHVQFSLQMPKSWNEGTVIAQFIWSHPSTTTNFGVTWAIQAVALANDDAGDTAFGTAVLVDDTGGTTDDVYISPESTAITVAGTPAAEEWVVFQVYRDVSDANDTLAVDARLHGVKIHWTKDALSDD